jgi:hypothetical protein
MVYSRDNDPFLVDIQKLTNARLVLSEMATDESFEWINRGDGHWVSVSRSGNLNESIEGVCELKPYTTRAARF